MKSSLITAVAAVVLSLGAAASPVLAQSYTAPAGIPAAAAPGAQFSAQGRSDGLTTGSIDRRPLDDGHARQPAFAAPHDRRAAGGNAR